MFFNPIIIISLITFASSTYLPPPLPAHIIWQPTTPANAWLECLTSRPSTGDLLITRYDTGEIWSINPLTTTQNNATLITSIPGANSSLGIDEIEDDVFAINAGSVTNGDRRPIEGTWGVWKVDLRGWRSSNNDGAVKVGLIKKIPEAKMLNGLAILNPATTRGPRAKGPDAKPMILTADSTAGILYSLDLDLLDKDKNSSARIGVFYSNPDLLAPLPDSAFPTGLNGLQLPPVRNPKYIYFATGFRGTFYRLALNQSTPSLELLATGYTNLDDFALEPDGTAYLSTSTDSKIVKVTPDGEETVVIESEMVMSGTAVHFVEREDGKKLLYVNTGSARNFGNGSAGKLVEIWL